MIERKYILATMVAVSVSAALYGFLYPYISGEIKSQKRQAALSGGGPERRINRGVDPVKRRRAITESLKEMEEGGKIGPITLDQRIAQAGVGWSTQLFYLLSLVCGLVAGLPFYVGTGNWMIALGAFVVCAFVIPRWALSYLQKRRIAKFVEHFPDSIDVIIRGVKAGLPLGECFRLIAFEGQEPVRSEFKSMVDAQSIGMTMGEAIERFAQRLPVAEASFFAIVITLQQKTGGNLAEALGNLSRVLRDRKKMKAKVRSMAAEAKASAGIIGALPFLVGGAVSVMNPSYMGLLFTTSFGQICVGGGLVWMGIGVFIMHKMINFDF
jgi:tight adherence protein B